MDTSIVAGFQSKINNRMANIVDPDETARYEPFHLDLHCLQRHLHWSVGRKGLSCIGKFDFQIRDIYGDNTLLCLHINMLLFYIGKL